MGKGVRVHADHRRESYVDGMEQVNETGGIDRLKRTLTKYSHFTY